MDKKWDIRFLEDAARYAQWGKDPSTKVGAVIAKEKEPLSRGYNGFAPKVKDTEERLNTKSIKYMLTIHAEENAIFRAYKSRPWDLEGSTIYVYPYFTCASCASKIITAGIKRVVVPTSALVFPEHWSESFQLAMEIYEEAGVIVETIEDQYITLP